MTINVKYLSEREVEREALGLLRAYFRERGQPIQIPIPAEEILETHLGLSLDFDDLQAMLGIPDVLGALWADKREVFIDQTLEPEENPHMQGRYFFSVGHEIGHWQLHRQYITNAEAQVVMSMDRDPEPIVICRSSQAKERIEWQADYFSSCFLMPRQCVYDVWTKCFGSLKPIIYVDDADPSSTHRPMCPDLRPMWGILSESLEQTDQPYGYDFDAVSREFAFRFKVSTQAMRIRLQTLGLLQIDPEMPELLGGI